MQLSYRKIWMTDAQWECCEFFADLFRGFHHVNGVFKDAGDNGIEVNTSNNYFATYDFDYLTLKGKKYLRAMFKDVSLADIMALRTS